MSRGEELQGWRWGQPCISCIARYKKYTPDPTLPTGTDYHYDSPEPTPDSQIAGWSDTTNGLKWDWRLRGTDTPLTSRN